MLIIVHKIRSIYLNLIVFVYFFVMKTRKNLNPISLAESDDDLGDFSKGSDEEWKISPRNSCGFQDSENSSSIPDDESNLSFDTTTGFTLKIIKCINQSKHPVYSLVGQLMSGDKVVNRVKDKLYCLKCFNQNTYKR